MTIETRFLGTASGLPAADRFGQTIVLTHRGDEEYHYILDAGDGASSLLTRHGFDHRKIRGVFVSHMHADHHGGLVQIVKTAMHIGRTEDLYVLAPAEGIAPLQAYFEASYLLPEWLGYPIHWIPLTECVEQAFELPGGLAIQAHPNQHLANARERLSTMANPPTRVYSFESYSAACEWHGARIIYSGNLNGPAGSDEMAHFAEPCDLLIAELAHVDPGELGRFLAGRHIYETAVTHYEPDWDLLPAREVFQKIVQGAGATGIRGRLTLAHDGDVFNVEPHTS